MVTARATRGRALLVAISGIDGSGKSTLASQMAELLEGIFLLRRDLRGRYDLAFWVECSFETALARALARNQEGQSEARLRDDYARIYFAAQRHHIGLDAPAEAADGVIWNGDTISRALARTPGR